MKHLVACGKCHSIFVLNGKVYSFGQNESGQLGLGSRADKKILNPMLINKFRDEKGLVVNVNIVFVACGYSHSIFISDDGRVFVCGTNLYGQLGLGKQSDEYILSPRQITSKFFNNKKIVFADGGAFHSVFITEDREAYVCGDNMAGQLGITKNMYGSGVCQPIQLKGVGKVKFAACGENLTLYIALDGEVHLVEDPQFKNKQPRRNNQNTKFSAVSCGYKFSILLSTKGQAFCCKKGKNDAYRIKDTLENKNIIFAGCEDEYAIFISDKWNVYICSINRKALNPISKPLRNQKIGHRGKNHSLPHLKRYSFENPKNTPRIISAACGGNHSILMTSEGHVYFCGVHGRCGNKKEGFKLLSNLQYAR